MKNYMAKMAIKNMIFSVPAIVLLPIQLAAGIIPTGGLEVANTDATAPVVEEVPPSASPRVVLLDLEGKYYSIESYLDEKYDTIEFLGKTFGIDSLDIYEDLVNKNEKYIYEKNNIGRLVDKNGELKTFKSFEEGLIEYLFDFASKNPKLVSNKTTPYTGSADYVVDLIKYFTGIYDNVDYLTAVSIGAAESGYYKVKYMLNCNNVYGGMGKNGLIKYKNIEYGVLSYIRLLSKNYYGKGLNTLESIGRVYCPTTTASGAKVASAHWINLVTTAKSKYAGTEEIIEVGRLLND